MTISASRTASAADGAASAPVERAASSACSGWAEARVTECPAPRAAAARVWEAKLGVSSRGSRVHDGDLQGATMPSFMSSPRIRCVPQVGFSAAICAIRSLSPLPQPPARHQPSGGHPLFGFTFAARQRRVHTSPDAHAGRHRRNLAPCRLWRRAAVKFIELGWRFSRQCGPLKDRAPGGCLECALGRGIGDQ